MSPLTAKGWKKSILSVMLLLFLWNSIPEKMFCGHFEFNRGYYYHTSEVFLLSKGINTTWKYDSRNLTDRKNEVIFSRVFCQVTSRREGNIKFITPCSLSQKQKLHPFLTVYFSTNIPILTGTFS
jgi:hypothetical protein